MIPQILQLAYRTRRGIASRWRNLYYRLMGVKIAGQCWIQKISITGNWHKIHLGNNTALDDGVMLKLSGNGTITIGDNTYINCYTIISAGGNITIGKNCLIGSHSFITDGIHGQSPEKTIKEQETTHKDVTLGDDVWIGAGSIILAGVKIGSGAIIGAGSVVTQDIPPGTIAVSIGARVIKNR